VRVKLGDGTFRRIPTVRDERDWRELVIDDVIGEPFVAVDRRSRKRPNRIQRPVRARSRHEV
jgi:hypothetical protein